MCFCRWLMIIRVGVIAVEIDRGRSLLRNFLLINKYLQTQMPEPFQCSRWHDKCSTLTRHHFAREAFYRYPCGCIVCLQGAGNLVRVLFRTFSKCISLRLRIIRVGSNKTRWTWSSDLVSHCTLLESWQETTDMNSQNRECLKKLLQGKQI